MMNNKQCTIVYHTDNTRLSYIEIRVMKDVFALLKKIILKNKDYNMWQLRFLRSKPNIQKQ